MNAVEGRCPSFVG